GTKYGIGQRKAWTTGLARLRFGDSAAQVEKQRLEFVLFSGLCLILDWPVLRIFRAFRSGHHHLFGDDRCCTVSIALSANRICDSENVFAFSATYFVVRARAFRISVSNAGHAVKSPTCLRRDNPVLTFLPNRSALSQLDAALLTYVHVILHLLLQCSYIVAHSQVKTLPLTCSYSRTTLW